MSCLELLAVTIFVAGFANTVQPSASAQQFAIGAYHLQSTAKDTKELHIDTYSVDLVNNGPAAQAVTASAVSLDPNTVVQTKSVNFGSVPANTTIANAATFTVTQNVLASFNPDGMVWAFNDPSSIQLSATSYTFPDTFTTGPTIRAVATLTNTGDGLLALNPTISGNGSFTLAAGGCGHTVAPATSCVIMVQFLPIQTNETQHAATLNLGITSLPAGMNQNIALAGVGIVLAPGTVAPTANTMVAQYTLTLPEAGSWSVNFGTTESYGLTTGVQPATASTPSSLYVAGMLPNTLYHMQAVVTLPTGVTAVEPDLTFTTGALPPGIPATVPVTLTAGMTPQPGVELVNTIGGAIPSNVFATDLQGNVIWAYQYLDQGPMWAIYPVRLLPNGHFLSMIAPGLPMPASPTSYLDVIREFDVAGNTIQQLSMTDLNTRLAANGFNVTLCEFSHDILLLPNSHYLVIANTQQSFTDLPGYPGVTVVTGDTVVDLDSNFQPTWLWNSFDHLDINRHPMQFPDWTHANSLAYSADDGNFLISLRHQNWVLKIDYENGAGTGNVIWHLGEGGDFTLTNGVDPTDWNYAQHYANFISPNTTGVFDLELFDNGDDREFPEGLICGPLPGQTPCLYSTVQHLQIDENAMTATFTFHDILPHALYSYFAGNSELLPDGDVEFNLAGAVGGADTFEVIPGASLTTPPQTVWEMTLPGSTTYRVLRLPSLYPGVQW
jgi:hypothetical protein